jgi:DNA-binding transcriptional MerR regulator
MYSIGAFAKLTGVTPKALYLYERHGLLKPRRTRAGYRRYTLRDLQQLERVVSLKALGLPLKQIGALNADQARLSELLARQRAALEEKRQRIDRAVSAIDAIAGDGRPADALDRFFREANWERWEAKRRAAAAPGFRAPDRASPSRLALFNEIAAAIDRDPSGAEARPLVARWHALLEAEAGGDADTAAQRRMAWKARHGWPEGLKQYVASLYETEPVIWERVAALLSDGA